MQRGNRRYERQGFRRGDALLLALAAALALIALILGVMLMRTQTGYQGLSKRAVLSGSGSSSTAETIDWDTLRTQNAETVAWLAVEGTSIDYPVVQRAQEPHDWYLTHDFWGNWNPLGCPYLDRRASANGQHMLVFGHQGGASGLMFSPLRTAAGQGTFDTIGNALWSTPGDGTIAFKPVCALEVDMGYAAIQRFGFPSEKELRTWLKQLLEASSARNADASRLVNRADRVLTLVTCSELVPGQRTRTLVVFAAP